MPEVVAQGIKNSSAISFPNWQEGERNMVFKLQKATMKATCKCHSKTGKETVKLLTVKSMLKNNKNRQTILHVQGQTVPLSHRPKPWVVWSSIVPQQLK